MTWGRFWKWMRDTHPAVTFMCDVTPEIAGQFAAWLTAEGRSPNTFNKYMNLLALVFRTVKDKARLTVNPWEGIQRKQLVTHGRRELTIAELRKVTAAASGDLRILLALGIYTGMRLGDCATLRWAEVDLARGRIVRIPNKTGRNNPKPVIVPIHPTLSALLSKIPKAGRTADVLPRIAADYARHRSYVTDRVQALFKACSIETCRKVEGRKISQVEVGFHSLRHSFVSLCREANAPLSVVEAIVGHSNPAMTRHYTHTSEAAATTAVAALPDITGKSRKALPPAAATRQVDAEAVRQLADRLNGDNWKAIQGELRALVKG
jgi:integrase